MSVTSGVSSMKESEATEMFNTNKVGILCLNDKDKPYGVPLEHYYDGKNLFFAASIKHGERKLNCIKNNGNACYIIYDSRREQPELIQKDIRCRSVMAEGKITQAAIKEVDDKEAGKVKLQILKIDIEKISKWECPRKKCHWHDQWFVRHPDLVEGL